MKATILSIAVASLLLSLLALGGCGEKTKDPQQLLDEAVQAARDAGSVHAQMSVGVEPLEGESGIGLNVQGDAWLDMEAKALEARFTAMGMEFSLRYVDGKAYLQFGGDWHVVTGEIVSGIGPGAVGAAVDILASYPDLFANVVEVNELGNKNVGEFKCVELEVVPDLAAIASLESVQKLAAELEMSPEEIEDYLEGAELEMKVCVQKDDPIIREVTLVANLELPEMGDIAGISVLPKKAHVQLVMDFPEYGMQVEVQAPPDAKPFEGL